MKTFEQIAELEKRYLLGTYNRYPIVLTRGKGVFLYDLDDNRYLDFVSGLGVNALGHAHPRIVKTIREQAAKLIHVSQSLLPRVSGGGEEESVGRGPASGAVGSVHLPVIAPGSIALDDDRICTHPSDAAYVQA